MIWIYILIGLAAFFNACMDTFENTPNFNKSIFKKLDKRFWCKDVSCHYMKLILGYRFDSWHISKSLMWLCVITGFIVASFIGKPEYHWSVHFVWLSVTLNATFILFYNVIFRIK